MTTQLTGGSTSNLDALSVAGATTFATTPAVTTAQSMVRLNTANGYGSTNNKIRRFTTTVTNQGSDITYADSATLGASFTINTSGVYSVTYTDAFVGGNDFGVSVNTATPTTAIASCALSEIVCMSTTPAVNQGGCVGSTLYLAAGAVIRAHTDGAAYGGTRPTLFTITRVA